MYSKSTDFYFTAGFNQQCTSDFFPAPSAWTLTGIDVYLALTLQTVLIHISLKDEDA